MEFGLPTSVEVSGTKYEIRSDYRDVLNICCALSDNELDDRDKIFASLVIFYPDIDNMPPVDYQEAIKQCFWFINCGDAEQNQRSPKLVDWEQDFKYIVAPINRVCGNEIRAVEYMHWWTFVSAYYEIGGDCMFAEIVKIREKLSSGKALDKSEREWYKKNKSIVDLKTTYTKEESNLLNQWIKH